MPTPTKGPRLGGSPAHQKLMLANLATSLFTHGRIHTTRAKAERLRPYAERLITKAKKGDLHNRREISQQIRDKDVVHRLIAEIGPFFADRPGGYTRIIKTLPRKGDNATMAIIELVNEKLASTEASAATRAASNREVGGAATGAAATGATIAATESTDDTSAESTDETSTGSTGDTSVESTDDTTAAVEAELAVGTDAETDVPQADAATDDSEVTGATPADSSEESSSDASADDTATDLVTEPGDTDGKTS